MNNIPSRRERRSALKHAGILKKKSKLPFKNWLEITRENIKKGREIHAANLEAMEKDLIEQLETAESKAIENWKAEGYDKKEIEILREAWALEAVRDKETYKEDKKTAIELRKKANDSRKARV